MQSAQLALCGAHTAAAPGHAAGTPIHEAPVHAPSAEPLADPSTQRPALAHQPHELAVSDAHEMQSVFRAQGDGGASASCDVSFGASGLGASCAASLTASGVELSDAASLLSDGAPESFPGPTPFEQAQSADSATKINDRMGMVLRCPCIADAAR